MTDHEAKSANPSDRNRPDPAAPPAFEDKSKAAELEQARRESDEPAVSQPGGFKNDPDDPTNPNEVIERTRRKLRP